MTGVPFLDQPGAAEWQIAVGRVLKGADPVETLRSRTRDGIPVEPLYPAAEIPDGMAISRIGTGVGIVQRVDHPDLREAGAMARTDIANGASGLTLVFAGAGTARSFGLPTDQPDALPAVLDGLGTTPIALRCEFPPGADEALIDRVLEAVSAHGPGDAGPIDLAADPIGDAARIGRPVSAPDGASWASATASAAARWVRILTWRSVAGPLLRADGRPHHEAGASDAQELAAILSAGVSHLRALDRAGLGADRLAFTLAADADQILTIAKCRAIRRLWARVEDACGLQPAPIRLHAETAWRMLARKDAWTNLLRNTVACAGAILGGVDSITVLPFTSALGLPDVFARRLARNTPLVLLAESGLGRVTDPGAGSGAIEALTAALCREAWRRFQALEAAGGLAAALGSGAWQADVAATREARSADLKAGRTRLVGVTAFAPLHDAVPAVLIPMRPVSSAFSPGDSLSLPSIRDAEPFDSDMSDEVQP